MLEAGPANAQDLGRKLADAGVTKARDPGAAVRRALRDDPRAMTVFDGRFASVASALDGVTLTAMVDAQVVAERSLPVDGDLAPLSLLPLGPQIPLPESARPGSAISVRIDAKSPAALAKPLRRAGRRPTDEAALLTALRRHLRPVDGPGLASLALLVAEVAACNPSAFRAPGRPLTEVLDRAGYEVHLGWVGAAGTAWDAITEAHAHALEEQALALLAAEHVEESIALQERLVQLLDEHGVHDQTPPARRRLVRTMARHGRPEEARARLRESFPADDPEDRYLAAVMAHREGNHVEARRMVEEGLARAHDDFSEVGAALADLGGDLDAQAAFARARSDLLDVEDDAGALATVLVAQRRSYLVEALIDAAFGDLTIDEAEGLVRAIASHGGPDARDACIAIAAVLDGPVSDLARSSAAAPAGARAARPVVAGLVEAHPASAWATSREDAQDQVQLIIAVAKEDDRVAPLIALVDIEELDGGIKDAFFLPDMAPSRLRFEILDSMAENGLPAHEVPVSDAVARLRAGLEATRRRGWVMPSVEVQPVLARLERWVLGRTVEGGPATTSEA